MAFATRWRWGCLSPLNRFSLTLWRRYWLLGLQRGLGLSSGHFGWVPWLFFTFWGSRIYGWFRFGAIGVFASWQIRKLLLKALKNWEACSFKARLLLASRVSTCFFNAACTTDSKSIGVVFINRWFILAIMMWQSVKNKMKMIRWRQCRTGRQMAQGVWVGLGMGKRQGSSN